MLSRTSVVIPAKNEAKSLEKLIPAIKEMYPSLLEVIVVNDGSTDETERCAIDGGAIVVNHKYSRGNGAAIKTGARKATGDFICFMDADGQHKPESIERMLEKVEKHDLDMVVGARSRSSQAGTGRLIANSFFNWFASLITGFPIIDLTSGLRVFRRSVFMEFIHLLPNGFSYPTTTTMALLRSGYNVEFIEEDISAERLGNSHINPIRDGFRFLIIIFKIGTLYSPLKVFTPISASLFLVSFFYYLFTFITKNTLSNMSVILFTSSLIIFLIGLVSEQINSLMYMKSKD